MELDIAPLPDDYQGYFWYIFRITTFFTNIVFLVLITRRMVREFKSKYIDLFTLTQYFIVMCYSGYSFIYFIIWFFIIDLSIFNMFVVTDKIINLYFCLNLFCWYMMISHIECINKILSGHTYADIRVIIKRKEKVSFAIIIVISLTLVFISVFGEISSSFIYTDIYYNLLSLVVMVLFILILIVLYIKLINTLRKNLSYFYLANKTNLRILFAFNFTIFT